MNLPDKCPKCGAGRVALNYHAFACGTLASRDGHCYHTAACDPFSELPKPLDQERDALAERVKSLIAERDTARMQADRQVTLRDELRALLGTDDIEEGVNRIKAMQAQVKALENERDDAFAMLGVYVPERDELKARVKELEAYAERLEEAGCSLYWECLRFSPRQDPLNEWTKAKETKP